MIQGFESLGPRQIMGLYLNWLEKLPHKEKVVGSYPTRPTKHSLTISINTLK